MPTKRALFLLALVFVAINQRVVCAASNRRSGKKEDPKRTERNSRASRTPFFIRDSEGLCLADGNFKRCTADTLWYQTGTTPSIALHKWRSPADKSATGGLTKDLCLRREKCSRDDELKVNETLPLILGECASCGSEKFSFSPYKTKSNSEYYVIFGSNSCMTKNNASEAILASCSMGETSTFTFDVPDLKKVTGDAAKLINAAADNDSAAIRDLVKVQGIDVNSRYWDDSTPLMSAAKAGHVEVVRELLQLSADVNLADRDGATALIDAALAGHSNVLKVILEEGGEVAIDTTTDSGLTALWASASKGDEESVTLLLDRGANPNLAIYNGESPLMIASLHGFRNIVQALIRHKADVNALNNNDYTAFTYAAENGTVDVLQDLLDAGANVNAVSKQFYTPLVIASAHGHFDAVKLLVENKASVDGVLKMDMKETKEQNVKNEGSIGVIDEGNGTEQRDDEKSRDEKPQNVTHDLDRNVYATPLMYACSLGHEDIVKYLLAHGAIFNYKNKDGSSAIMEATSFGSLPIFKALVDAGADPASVDNEGANALHMAAHMGRLEIVRHCLSMKMDVNAKSELGETSLMYAAIGGYVDVVKALIEAGSDVNARTYSTEKARAKNRKDIADGKEGVTLFIDDMTALHFAAKYGHLEVLKLLAEAGAEISTINKMGDSPLVDAVRGGFYHIAAYIVDSGASISGKYIEEETGKSHKSILSYVLSQPAAEGSVELIMSLISKGADIPAVVDSDGNTILLKAIELGSLPLVKAILDRPEEKERMGISNLEGISPLYAAAAEGHIDILKLLLSLETSNTPSSKISGGSNNESANAKKGGIDINAPDKDGTTALMTACVRGHKNVVEILLQHHADVNLQNVEGHTALTFAFNGKNQMIHLQQKYAEYVKGGNSTRKISDSIKTYSEIVQILLKHGALASLPDTQGRIAKDFDYHASVGAEVKQSNEL